MSGQLPVNRPVSAEKCRQCSIAMARRLGECPPQLPLGVPARHQRTKVMIPFRLARRLCAASAFGLAASLMVALAAPAGAQEQDPVVAKVNGVEIRASDVAIAEEELGSNLQQFPPETKREYVVTYLSDTMLVAQAAEAKKLAETPEFKRRLAAARNKILMETLLQSETKAAVTDAAMQRVYDDATKQMGSEKEVHARHILVETEEEAKQIAAELKKGGDFAELAKRSKEPGAGERAGDLGYFTKDQMVPAFSDAAFALEPGKISEPVKTEFGWHVIKLEDKRDRVPPPFDQVKGQIETYLVRKTQSDLITKLREGAKIERVNAPAPEAGEAKKP
jgi:peptidyl-prolyl cis-trans isomerase C